MSMCSYVFVFTFPQVDAYFSLPGHSNTGAVAGCDEVVGELAWQADDRPGRLVAEAGRRPTALDGW